MEETGRRKQASQARVDPSQLTAPAERKIEKKIQEGLLVSWEPEVSSGGWVMVGDIEHRMRG